MYMLFVCLSFATGITLSLNSVQYTNNSVVTITNIGTGSAALLCTTTRPGCCFSGQGNEWYLPNGTPLSNSNTQPYYRTRSRSPGTVLLHRNLVATTTGVFNCTIPDASGDLQSIYVGIYTATTGEQWICVAIVHELCACNLEGGIEPVPWSILYVHILNAMNFRVDRSPNMWYKYCLD